LEGKGSRYVRWLSNLWIGIVKAGISGIGTLVKEGSDVASFSL